MDDAISLRAIPDGTQCRDKPGATTLLTLCLAVLVAQVDTAVVNLATRPIGDHFNAGVIALQWVIDSYNFVYAVLLLTGGLLADLYGRRRIFMIGAALFTIASLICALAPSIAILICGRALAGVGAALLLPASLAIIRVVWRDEAERGRALGIWAACNGLAMAIGPTLGGLLINQFGWRSIFVVVVPLSLAALVFAMAYIPESSDPQDRHFDAPAQLLGALALGSLAFAAIQSHDAPAIAMAAFGVAAIALFAFIKTEAKRGAAALVPLDIFSSREFRGAVIATIGMTFGMYGTLFLVPLTWQSTGRFDATAAGIALMPMALIFVLVSPFSGKLTERFGVRHVTCGGVAVISIGLLLIGLSTHQASIVPAEVALALTGLGMGFATGPLMGAAVAAVAAARSGTASALINVARMAGATIGVAILGAVFAVAHGGADGLRAAMLCGGAVQIICAAVAWTTTPAPPVPKK
ncbi:MFS transporter [Roseiarcaceae bacterium H3SJ34-1]|uniref:MFS transporter n=1 Tax=Terripilifer ovatus TaxID=3032367 RepID=UPI003AB92C4B|nr:MFS transporter [Roseiarcaceae bacterium H3SJ34-1]